MATTNSTHTGLDDCQSTPDEVEVSPQRAGRRKQGSDGRQTVNHAAEQSAGLWPSRLPQTIYFNSYNAYAVAGYTSHSMANDLTFGCQKSIVTLRRVRIVTVNDCEMLQVSLKVTPSGRVRDGLRRSRDTNTTL